MADSPLYNVGRPRRSFLDEDFTGDARLRDWARETGRIRDVEREGSDFYQMEAPDPSRGFLGSFVARKRSKGLPTDMAGGKELPYDAQPIYSGADKTYEATLNNRQAASFIPDFRQDMARSEAEARRAQAIKEQIDAENRASARKVQEVKELGAANIGNQVALAKAIREDQASDPEYQRQQEMERAKLQSFLTALGNQTADIGRLRGEQATVRAEAEARKAKAKLFKASTPEGQYTYQTVLDETGDPMAAMSEARAADERALEDESKALAGEFGTELGKFSERDTAWSQADPDMNDVNRLAGLSQQLQQFYSKNRRMGGSAAARKVRAILQEKLKGNDMAEILRQRIMAETE